MMVEDRRLELRGLGEIGMGDGGWPTAFMYVAIRNMTNKRLIMPEIEGILCYACNVYHVSVVLAYFIIGVRRKGVASR